MSAYRYPDDIAASARNPMLPAIVAWLDRYPKADPRFSKVSDDGQPPMLLPVNDDAEDLLDAILGPGRESVLSEAGDVEALAHAAYVRKYGWDAYIEELREGAEK